MDPLFWLSTIWALLQHWHHCLCISIQMAAFTVMEASAWKESLEKVIDQVWNISLFLGHFFNTWSWVSTNMMLWSPSSRKSSAVHFMCCTHQYILALSSGEASSNQKLIEAGNDICSTWTYIQTLGTWPFRPPSTKHRKMENAMHHHLTVIASMCSAASDPSVFWPIVEWLFWHLSSVCRWTCIIGCESWNFTYLCNVPFQG